MFVVDPTQSEKKSFNKKMITLSKNGGDNKTKWKSYLTKHLVLYSKNPQVGMRGSWNIEKR